jgi:SPP1 gp7 family putative phage head morphogenesis protein
MYNSLVRAALNQVAKFITGNEIKVVSEDERTAEFLQKYLDDRGFEYQQLDCILKTLITGNGYMEIDYSLETGLPDRFYSIADPSRIYINFDKYGNPKSDQEAYLQRVDPIYNEPDARWYELSYHIGYSYHKIRIKAIPVPWMKLVHFKLNQSINGVYGRSDLASIINDTEMLEEMERALAMIAKYRAVPKKIISFGDKDFPTNAEEIDSLAAYLENLAMEENAIVNKPYKMEDLSFSGKEINLDYALRHTKRKIIAGIAPEFLVGLTEDVNRATAKEQLVAFIMSVMSDRKVFTSQIERFILKPVIEKYGLAKDAHIEFGKLDFEDVGSKANRISQMWTTNQITLNEARKELDMSEVEGGNIYYGQWQAKLAQQTQVGQPTDTVKAPTKKPIYQTPSIKTPTMSPIYSNYSTLREELGGFEYSPAANYISDFIRKTEFSDLKKTYSDDEVDAIKIVLNEGIMRGKPTLSISDDVMKAVNETRKAKGFPDTTFITKEEALRIARTETMRVLNGGTLNRYSDMGVDKVKWNSVPEDGRRCAECDKMNGKIFTVGEAIKKIPLHPNCRCVWMPVI